MEKYIKSKFKDLSMKKIYLILLLIMIVTSCSKLSGINKGGTGMQCSDGKTFVEDECCFDKNNNQICDEVEPFRSLSLNFVQDQPPSVVGFNELFDVAVDLSNKGDDYAGILLKFIGFDPRMWKGGRINETHSFSLDRDKQTQITLKRINVNPDVKVDSFMQELRAEACFESYDSKATIMCDPECRIINTKSPLNITKAYILQSNTGKTNVNFLIKNHEDGQLFTHKSKCNPTIEDLNNFWIKVTPANLAPCFYNRERNQRFHEGYLRLIGDQATIDCELNKKFDGNLQISVEIQYDYRLSSSRTIKFVS